MVLINSQFLAKRDRIYILSPIFFSYYVYIYAIAVFYLYIYKHTYIFTLTHIYTHKYTYINKGSLDIC